MATVSNTPTQLITTLIEANTNIEGMVEAPTDVVDRALEEIVVKPKRASKKKRDPDAPKRPMSAYFLWLGENRDSIGEEYCSDLTGRDKVVGVTRKAGELWKELSDEEKQPFTTKASTLHEEYQEKMKLYKPEMVVKIQKKKTSGPKYDPEHLPEATEGWSGPFKMRWLAKKVKGFDGKNIRLIKTFDDAVSKALEVNQLWEEKKSQNDFPAWWKETSRPCEGITKTSTGYDLRSGTELEITEEKYTKTGIASWVLDGNTVSKPTPKSSVETNELYIKPYIKELKECGEAYKAARKDFGDEDPLRKKFQAKTPTTTKVTPSSKYPESELEVIEVDRDGVDVELFFHDKSGEVFEKNNLEDPVGKVDDDEITFF